MDHKQKYLKYKKKYLQLKGGLLNIDNNYKNITSFGFEFETSLMPFFGEVKDGTLILTPFGYKENSRDDTQNRSNTKIKLKDIQVNDILVGELLLTQDSYDVFNTPESKQINVTTMTIDEALTKTLNYNTKKFKLEYPQDDDYNSIQFNVQEDNNLTIGDTEFVCTFRTSDDNIFNINMCSEMIISRLKKYFSPPNCQFIGTTYISYDQYSYDQDKNVIFNHKNTNFGIFKVKLDDIANQFLYVLSPFIGMYDDVLYKYIYFTPQITLGTSLNNVSNVIMAMIENEKFNNYVLDPVYKFDISNYLILLTIDKLRKQIDLLSKISTPINYETLDENILISFNVSKSLIKQLKGSKTISEGIKLGKELDKILKPKNIAIKLEELNNNLRLINNNKEIIQNYLFFYYLYVDVENIKNYISDNNNFEIHKYDKAFLPRQHFHELLDKTPNLKDCIKIIYNTNFEYILTYRIKFLQYSYRITNNFHSRFRFDPINIPLNFYENYETDTEVSTLVNEYISTNFSELSKSVHEFIIKILLHEMPMFIGIKNSDSNDQINSFTTRIPYDGEHVIFEYRSLFSKTKQFLSSISNFLNDTTLDILNLVTKRYKTEYLINRLSPENRTKYYDILTKNEHKIVGELLHNEDELIDLINIENPI